MDTNFPQHTKEAWLERVKRELPEGKTLADLHIQHPLYQHDGFSWPSGQNQVAGFLPTQEWKITARSITNTSCLQALQNGAEALWVSPQKEDLPDDLFAGVHLDFIHTLIDLSSLEGAELTNWTEWLNVRSAISSLIPISGKPMKNYYQQLGLSGTSQDALFDVVQQLKTSWQNESPGWVIHHVVESDFYGEIALLRALRSIFLEMESKESMPKKLYLVAQLEPLSQDANQDLIRFTYQALSAVLGGVDYLAGPAWTHGDHNYARLVQNLQHLMKQEGKLHLFNDAMAGSYFMEEITLQLVESTLVKLKD